MNKDTLHGDWNTLKGKIKQRWSRLTDDDLGAVEGNFDELSGRIQKAYGYTKEKASAEFDSFKQKLNEQKMSERNDDDDDDTSPNVNPRANVKSSKDNSNANQQNY